MTDIKQAIRNLTSASPEARRDAKAVLLKQSSSARGIAALVKAGIKKACEAVINDLQDEERQTLAICRSNVARHEAGRADEWNRSSLEGYRRYFDNMTTDKKEKRLEAVRWFAYVSQDRADLVVKAGWVDVAMSCEQRLYGRAILLLDAVRSIVCLPELLIKVANTKAMLAHVLGEGKEHEQSAGLRVASCVLASLKQGSAGGLPLSQQIVIWLKEVPIVRALLFCIKPSARQANVDSAVDLLTMLSKHTAFLEDLGKEGVVSVLVDQAFETKRGLASMFGLLHRALVMKEAADAFTAGRGLALCLDLLSKATTEDALLVDVMSVLSVWLPCATGTEAANAFTDEDGLNTCLLLLGNDDRGLVKGVLALLNVWSNKSTNSFTAYEQRPDLADVVNLVSVSDLAISDSACGLYSWALHCKSKTGLGLVQPLEHEALDSFMRFLVQSSMGARYAIGALEVLINASVHDKESARRFVAAPVIDRLLISLRRDSLDEMHQAAIRSLAVLVKYSTNAALVLVGKGVIGILVSHLETINITDETNAKNLAILLAVNTILVAAGFQGVPRSDIPAVRKLVKVKSPPPPRLIPAAFGLLVQPSHPKLFIPIVSLYPSPVITLPRPVPGYRTHLVVPWKPPYC
jgi:hypothetical protein